MNNNRHGPLLTTLLSLFLPGSGQLLNAHVDDASRRRELVWAVSVFSVWCAGWVWHLTLVWLSMHIVGATLAAWSAHAISLRQLRGHILAELKAANPYIMGHSAEQIRAFIHQSEGYQPSNRRISRELQRMEQEHLVRAVRIHRSGRESPDIYYWTP